ncbi:hypothetical protein FRC00_013497, partial [Tulasnella sp. 408]
MTGSMPYSPVTNHWAIIVAIVTKSLPGSIDALDNVVVRPAVDPTYHTGVSSLRSIIIQCWDFDPEGRPSSSIILQSIAPGEDGDKRPEFPPVCLLKGCDKPAIENSKFCSDQHRGDAVTEDGMPACILCKEYPKAVGQFCSQECLEKAQGQAPMLISVDQMDPMFSNVVNQFDVSWRHSYKPKPTVAFVYKIVLSKQLTDSYLAY